VGSLPERRSNMAGCVADDGYLYIYGGQDLREGVLSSLWRIQLSEALKGDVTWENITATTTNAPSYAFSHHCGVCYQNKLYFFGGYRQYAGNLGKYDRSKVRMKNSLPQSINILDLATFRWTIGPTLNVPRDDFAWAFDDVRGKLYVFGGFVNQVKVNDLMCFDLETRKFSSINEGTSRPASANSEMSGTQLSKIFQGIRPDLSRPVPRTGSRMAFCQEDNCLYLFGGQNTNAETVNDFWCFSLSTSTWRQLKPEGEIPQPRSGHSFMAIGKSILMFGGLIEITKECNETFRYCIETNTWFNLRICPSTARAMQNQMYPSRTDATPASVGNAA
jgi:hypothetical protein